MQPRPSAETSRSLFPSLRFCIAPPDVLVLRVANLLHPVHSLAVELFLNGDVRHGGRCPGAVSVLLTWRNPDNVTGPNLLDRSSPALREAGGSRDEKYSAGPLPEGCEPALLMSISGSDGRPSGVVVTQHGRE